MRKPCSNLQAKEVMTFEVPLEGKEKLACPQSITVMFIVNMDLQDQFLGLVSFGGEPVTWWLAMDQLH